jgi:uncharacterized membrane protein YeaQ/YmgE (transglycosylase-associated protein family)
MDTQYVRKILILTAQAGAIAPPLDLFKHRPSFPVEGACVMSVIGWIILGLIAGFIASKIVNKTGMGFFMDLFLGIVGAIVGGVIFSALGASGVTGLNLYSMVVAVIGAVIVLVAYHWWHGRRAL